MQTLNSTARESLSASSTAPPSAVVPFTCVDPGLTSLFTQVNVLAKLENYMRSSGAADPFFQR